MLPARAYALQLADNLIKVAMEQFFQQVVANFYPDQDIAFMNYFLELALIDPTEFVVHHSKLIEYGIMTCENNSSKVGAKLSNLGLKEGVDYLLADIRQQDGKHGGSNKKHYHLTPPAFKKCLMRARRYANQPIDPVIYCDYYLLLEIVHALFAEYERVYSVKVTSMKDDKIDALSKEIREQSSQIKDQSSQIKDQSAQIRELLGYAKNTKNQLDDVQSELHEAHYKIDDLHTKFDEAFDFATELGRMSLHMWVGPSVFKTQLDHLIQGHTLSYALKHLKVMYLIAFYADGQKEYVERKVAENVSDEACPHEVLLSPFYNANPIDLRNNAQTEFIKQRKELITRVNAENHAADAEYNAHQKELIKGFNTGIKKQISDLRKQKTKEMKKGSPDAAKVAMYEKDMDLLETQKMVFVKHKTTPVKVGDITIDFKRSQFTYVENAYMTFEDVLKLVSDVNITTQANPVPIDDELTEIKKREPVESHLDYSDDDSDEE